MTVFRLLFSGHGCKGTGDWVTAIKGEYITCNELFKAIRDGGFTGTIELNIDCCYSGNWCHKVKESLDKKEVPFADFEEIIIYTSSDSLS